MTKQWLTKLAVEEISLVDEPANKGARVLLMKRNDERVGLIEKLAEMVGIKAEAHEDGVVLKSNKGEEMDGQVKKQLDEMSAEIVKLRAINVRAELSAKIAKAKDTTELDAALAEITKLEDADSKAGLTTEIKSRKSELSEIDKQGKFKEFRNKLSGAMKAAFDQMDEDEKKKFMTKFAKSAEKDDPVVKALEKLTKTNEALVRKVDDLEANQELAVLKVELKDLEGVVNLDDFAKTYSELRKSAPEAAVATLTKMRALAKQVQESGLFDVIGKSGASKVSDSESALDTAVKKYRERHPDVTAAVAESEVLKANPGLYEAYNDEHVTKARGE